MGLGLVSQNDTKSYIPCIIQTIQFIHLFTDLPDPVSNCTAFNSTAYSIQIACIPGNDGGIKQHFHIEVNYSYIHDDERNVQISICSFFAKKKNIQVFEESTRNKLFNISFANPNFILKKLPSDTKLIIKVKNECAFSIWWTVFELDFFR